MASKLARYSWLPGGLAAAVIVAIGKLLAASSFTPLEFAIYDRAQRAANQAAADNIVIVDIDRASLEEFGAWPWPRNMHANLIEKLHHSGARVIAFVTPLGAAENENEVERIRAALRMLEASKFEQSAQAQRLREMLATSSTGQDPNVRLARAIATHGKVILPVRLRMSDRPEEVAALPEQLLFSAGNDVLNAARYAVDVAAPMPMLMKSSSALGHTLLPADADGIVRSDLIAVRVGDGLLPSMALAIALRASDISLDDMTLNSLSTLRVADRPIHVDGHLRVHPQYFGRYDGQEAAGDFVHYSYQRVLNGEVPPAELRDKIVLVGFADPETYIATPVDPSSTPVMAIASTVSGLLVDATYARPGTVINAEWLVTAVVLLFAAFVLPATGLRVGALASGLVIIILATTEIGLLRSAHIWAQLMLPCAGLAAGFATYAVSEMIRRANVKSGPPKDPSAQLRSLGQTFQKQGQLDLAFETYRRCPMDAPTMELLYYLGLDFERRRQYPKAEAVYGYIATRDPNYRDLRNRRTRIKDDPVMRDTTPAPSHSRPAGVPPMRRSGRESGTTMARTLGRYEIERELGKGAMGVVYLGRDPKINRVVAIKAIPLAQEFGEEDLAEARARFFREAEMAGRLNHPAIVTVYDAGEDNGLAYIAMEYLRGQHLSYYTENSRLLPPETVMQLAARTAEALHYAHRQNVVHRDIKPANIMFNAETDELKITDFGIARLTDTSRTKTGIVLGTPSFMSPEQLEGRSLDGRSDQFALGVSLYQLLTGQLPFRGDSMPRLMQKIATEPHAPIRLVRPDLPPQIEAVVDRTLQKAAEDRYGNCTELAAALRACVKIIEDSRPARSEHEWLTP